MKLSELKVGDRVTVKQYGTDLTYNGQRVATATKVRRSGLNYAVTYSTGYVVVLPASAMTAELLAMVDA